MGLTPHLIDVLNEYFHLFTNNRIFLQVITNRNGLNLGWNQFELWLLSEAQLKSFDVFVLFHFGILLNKFGIGEINDKVTLDDRNQF